MNIFDQLEKIYNEIDAGYASIEGQARSKGHDKKEAAYYGKRQFNDQAYFLFMFTRLEDRIREISDKLVDNKVATLTDWKTKRVWEIIPQQQQPKTPPPLYKKYSLHFMQRVALLTPKGKKNFNLIKQYYDQRNNIGHGGTFTIAISIPTVIADMKRLYKDLKG